MMHTFEVQVLPELPEPATVTSTTKPIFSQALSYSYIEQLFVVSKVEISATQWISRLRESGSGKSSCYASARQIVLNCSPSAARKFASRFDLETNSIN